MEDLQKGEAKYPFRREKKKEWEKKIKKDGD